MLLVRKGPANRMLLFCFTLVCLLLPVDVFHLKKILVALLVMINIIPIFSSVTKRENLYLTFYGFLFPTLLIVYSALLTGNIAASFSRSYACYMLLLIFVIRRYGIHFERLLLSGVTVIMACVLLLFLLDITGIASVNESFIRNTIIYPYKIGLIGKSSEYPFYYKIFLKTSPLIVFLLFQKFFQKKYGFAFLAFAALFLTGTRANVGFSLIFLLLFFISRKRRQSIPIIISIALLAIIVTAAAYTDIRFRLETAFVANTQVSSAVRVDMVESLIAIVREKPWIILTGTGMGSSMLSLTRQVYIDNFEWSLLDLWRQMGLVFFSVFVIFMLYPLRPKSSVPAYKKYAYFAYLCIAATNPLLFSSTAFLVYIYMYSDARAAHGAQCIGRVDYDG